MARYTVIQLADQVIRLMERGSVKVSKPFDRREVARVIRDIASELLRGSIRERKMLGTNQVYEQYVITFSDIAVIEDVDREVFYAELPADPEDLPNGEGIMNVWPQTGKAEKDIAMIPLPLNADIILGRLPAGTIQQQFGFIPHRDRIEFTTITDGDSEITVDDEEIEKVRIQMVTTDPRDTADNEPFPMSPHLRPTLILRCLAMFGMPEKEAQRIVKPENKN
jgi:hypothetical protein